MKPIVFCLFLLSLSGYAVQAIAEEMTASQYRFLMRNLQTEFDAAKGYCMRSVGSARDTCVLEATDKRDQAQEELNRSGSKKLN